MAYTCRWVTYLHQNQPEKGESMGRSNMRYEMRSNYKTTKQLLNYCSIDLQAMSAIELYYYAV